MQIMKLIYVDTDLLASLVEVAVGLFTLCPIHFSIINPPMNICKETILDFSVCRMTY